MERPEGEEPFQEEGGPRIEPPEGDLAQGVDLRSGHRAWDEGRALIGEVPEVAGHRPVPLPPVEQIGSRERRQRVEVREVRIELQGELDGPQPLLEGLERNVP